MSKEQSLMLKGIAIIMMLFLHLFNSDTLSDSCHPLFFIGTTPFVNILTRACKPVDFFLILSGYGLYYLYIHGRDISWKAQGKRLLRLYITYWFILFLFVGIGSIIKPEQYPGDWLEVIKNITTWSCSYNGEHWFLFYYACISLTAVYIFKLVDTLKKWQYLSFFALCYFISAYTFSRYIAVEKLYDTVFAHFIIYVELTFCFVLGAFLYQIHQLKGDKIKWLKGNNNLVLLLLIVLIALKCCFKTSAFTFAYIFCFCTLFLQLQLNKKVSSCLQFLGKYSMIMWLTHTFFSHYLFHSFIYSFDKPIFIFLVLTIITIITAIPIKFIADTIISKLYLGK